MTSLLLLAGFAAAVGLRVAVGGVGVAQDPWAGLAFAVCLAALALPLRPVTRLSRRAVVTGVAGAAVLCVPVLLRRAGLPFHPAGGFWSWIPVVTVVAVAEEYFLRGALYEAVAGDASEGWAWGVGSVSFGLLHVPLYGWQVLPLDVAVGLVLSDLRRRAGTASAPAVAHVLADAAAWFLR